MRIESMGCFRLLPGKLFEGYLINIFKMVLNDRNSQMRVLFRCECCEILYGFSSIIKICGMAALNTKRHRFN